MKKVLFLTIGIMLSISLNAQWYHTYGVENVNDLTESQCNLALEKANSSIKTGQWMTFGGAVVSVIGIVIYSNSAEEEVNDIWEEDDYEVETGGITAGAVLAYGGAAICGIGIPVWISGANRKSQIEIALKKFETTYNSSDSFGVGVKITF